MPLQDLSVGSTSGLGSRQSEPTPENTSWWDNFTSAFTGSGGDDSNMSNPEDASSSLPVVDFGDDDSSADIYDEPEFTYEPEVYAAITDASTAGVFYTPDDIIQEAYEGDMAGKGEDKPDPLGNMGVPPTTLEDVTGTDAGALSNPDPLYKLADDIANPTITTTPLDQEAALRDALMQGQPSGLMSRPSSFTGSSVDVASNVPNWMQDLSASELADVLVGIREGTHDPDTGQPIQSVEDVNRSSSPRPQLRPEGFMAKVGDFDAPKYNLNKGMNPAITMDSAYQNVGTKPGQVNPNAQENLEKMLKNQYSTLMSNLDFDLTINDAIVKPGSTRIPNPAKGKKGTPGSRHFHGDALDISVRGLSTDQLSSLLEQSYKAGFRGFGFGNNILHLDLNGDQEKVRTWNYGNKYWGGNKAYPVSDVMSRVRRGIN